MSLGLGSLSRDVPWDVSDKGAWALCRFVDSLVYYGLSFQVGDFGLDIYLTQLVFGAVEVPARFSSVLMMEKLGRKWSQLCALTLAGIMCIIIIFIPGGTSLFPTLLPPSLPWLEPMPHPLQD